MFYLPIIPEDRPVFDAAPKLILPRKEKAHSTNKLHEKLQAREEELPPVSDKNWKLNKGFAKSKKMAYFLPIHDICTQSPSKSQVLEAIAQSPHSLLARETSYKRLPLHIACRMRACDDVIMTLLDLCPRAAQVKDSIGRLPLHYALANLASREVISGLVDAYPSGVSVQCMQGWLPLHLAISTERDFNLVTMILLKYPLGIIVKTKAGNDAISLAKRHGDYPDADAMRCFLHSVYMSVKRDHHKEYNAKAA